MSTKKIISGIELPANNKRENNGWIKEGIANCKFKDERLGKRFQKLMALP